MDVEMRASDEDRERAVAELQRHTVAGRLTLDEFAERVGAVYTARTVADLAALIRDLPAAPAPPRDDVTDNGRQLVIAFAVVTVVLVLLGLLMTLRP